MSFCMQLHLDLVEILIWRHISKGVWYDVNCCCGNERFFGTMEWSEDRRRTFVLEYWRASQQSRPWWRSSGSVASMLDSQRQWATGPGFVVWWCKERYIMWTVRDTTINTSCIPEEYIFHPLSGFSSGFYQVSVQASIRFQFRLLQGKPMGAVSVFMVWNYLYQPSEIFTAFRDVNDSCIFIEWASVCNYI